MDIEAEEYVANGEELIRFKFKNPYMKENETPNRPETRAAPSEAPPAKTLLRNRDGVCLEDSDDEEIMKYLL